MNYLKYAGDFKLTYVTSTTVYFKKKMKKSYLCRTVS